MTLSVWRGVLCGRTIPRSVCAQQMKTSDTRPMGVASSPTLSCPSCSTLLFKLRKSRRSVRNRGSPLAPLNKCADETQTATMWLFSSALNSMVFNLLCQFGKTA